MNDALAMGVGESLGDLCPDSKYCFERHPSGGDRLGQGSALEKLHGDVDVTVCLAGFIDMADVWMAERGRCAGFSEESRSGRFALDRLIGQELESYVAVKLRVMGAVNDAHSSSPESAQDLVVSDRLLDQGFHCSPERETEERME